MKAPFNCYAVYVHDGTKWTLISIIDATHRLSFTLKDLVRSGLYMAKDETHIVHTYNKGKKIPLKLLYD